MLRPIVLAGHSAGGLYVREYAREFLPEVTGVALIESSSPDQLDGYLASAPHMKRTNAMPTRVVGRQATCLVRMGAPDW
jgi:alpha-beta hydrolase superfamily lysophospholipase